MVRKETARLQKVNILRKVNSTIDVRICEVPLYRVCKFAPLNVVLIFVLNIINLHGGLNQLLNCFKFASVSQRQLLLLD